MSETWNTISDFLAWWLNHERLDPDYQSVLEKYYSSYVNNFNTYIKKHYSNQTKEVIDLIKQMENPNVLEVGCGCGTESLWFAINGASVHGIDIKEERLNVARERKNIIKNIIKKNKYNKQINIDFFNSSLFDLVEKNNNLFDIIFMEQTFHHIEPRNKVVSTLKKILKPHGYIVISESNGLNLLIQTRLLKKRGFKTILSYEDCYGKTHSYGNERIATARGIRNLFVQDGFNLYSLRYFRVFPNIKGIERLSWTEDKIPSWMLPIFTHYNIVMQLKG